MQRIFGLQRKIQINLSIKNWGFNILLFFLLRYVFHIEYAIYVYVIFKLGIGKN